MDSKSISNKLNTFYSKYFFAESNLLNLGILRIVLVLLAAKDFLGKSLALLKDPMLVQLHDGSLFTNCLGQWFFAFVSPTLLYYIFLASAIFALIGLFTRPALFLFGIFIIYLTGLKTSLGVFDHSNSLISQIILALAFIPGSTNLSVDRALLWIRKKSKGSNPTFSDLFSGKQDKIWGVRLLLILLACVYFTAGLSKIRYGGIEWLDGNTLTHYLSGNARPFNDGSAPPMYLSNPKASSEEKWKDGFGLYGYSYGNRQANTIALKAGEFVAENRSLIISLSILTVLFELSAFLLLIDGWPRTLYLVGAILLHTSIGFFMNLTFIQFRIICILLIDWQLVLSQFTYLFNKKRFEKATLPSIG